MSGGSYNYKYSEIDDYYVGKMYDKELDDLMNDLVEVTHDLEWWQSCDCSEEEYRETVQKFKEKWFKQPRTERLKKYIDESIEKTKKELIELVGEE